MQIVPKHQIDIKSPMACGNDHCLLDCHHSKKLVFYDVKEDSFIEKKHVFLENLQFMTFLEGRRLEIFIVSKNGSANGVQIYDGQSPNYIEV